LSLKQEPGLVDLAAAGVPLNCIKYWRNEHNNGGSDALLEDVATGEKHGAALGGARSTGRRQ
jgi:hypothetical protein